MTLLDWTIVFAMYALIVGSVILTKRYMRGVTDTGGMAWSSPVRLIPE